jgi:DNA-binding NarL/FixJ family response regulator
MAVIGEAADGETALSLIQDVLPSVAIADFQLLTISGLEVARCVRHHVPTTAVIIYTLFEEIVLIAGRPDNGLTVISK